MQCKYGIVGILCFFGLLMSFSTIIIIIYYRIEALKQQIYIYFLEYLLAQTLCNYINK